MTHLPYVIGAYAVFVLVLGADAIGSWLRLRVARRLALARQQRQQPAPRCRQRHRQAHNNGGQSAHQHLSLTADIPEFHFKCRCQTNGNTQQYHCISYGLPQTAFRTHCSIPDCLIDIHRIHLYQGNDHRSAHDQCKDQCNETDQKTFLPSGFVSSFTYL